MRENSCCFTGHRVQKLPWRFNENDKRCKAMKKTLYLEIEKAILRGYKYFLCGMALGFDTYCAEIVLKLRKKYPSIKLIGVSLVIALFNGLSGGTKSTLDFALKQGLEVVVIKP